MKNSLEAGFNLLGSTPLSRFRVTDRADERLIVRSGGGRICGEESPGARPMAQYFAVQHFEWDIRRCRRTSVWE